MGDQRLALINGRLYGPRETLQDSTASGADYKVVDVLPYKVLLECQGKKLELAYPDAASGVASGSSAGKRQTAPSQAARPRK